jgi:hypothetical protein
MTLSGSIRAHFKWLSNISGTVESKGFLPRCFQAFSPRGILYTKYMFTGMDIGTRGKRVPAKTATGLRAPMSIVATKESTRAMVLLKSACG